MLLQMPDGRSASGLVRADTFEDAAPVVQRVRQHVDLGVGPVHELSVHPDLVDLCDGHSGLLLSVQRDPLGEGTRIPTAARTVAGQDGRGPARS
jgi:hypothetical protein